MNNRINSILIILIILLIITPVIAADSYNYLTDRASSADGALTVKSQYNSIIYLFDNRKNVTAWSYDVHGNIGAVAISPDEKYIVVGSAGGLIWLFDQNGNVVWNKTFGNAGFRSIGFSEDGMYIDASTVMNQAFYLSLDGKPATRPVSTIVSVVVPSVTPVTTPEQISSNLNSSWIESLIRDNLNLLLGIIIGLCLAGITWVVVSRRENRETGIFRRIKNILTLRNFAIFSLILIGIGGVLVLYYPTQYSEISNNLIILGIAGLLIAYYLCAVIFWGTDSKLLATLMLAIPLGVWYFSTNKMTGSLNTILVILIIIAGYALISAILLFISDKIREGIIRYIVRSRRTRYPGYPPDSSYSLLGIVVISLIMMSLGSSAILSDNANNILKSPTDVSTGSQYVTVIPTIQAASLFNPIPLSTENYETGLTSRSFDYVLRGKTASVNVDLYSGVFSEIASKPTPPACTRYDYDSSPCTSEEIRQYYLKFIDDPDQKKYLDALVQSIESKTSNKDDQARIAISLVQQIPYDYSRLNSISFKMRTPYETLYENKGVCSEKSVLLAYILRELGYGVVLFEFPTQNHMAVGIKSPNPYDFKNSGYAFVETASPTIPTDSQGDYIGVGKLTSTPLTFHISDGSSFSSISEEYQDAVTFNQFGKGTMLSPERYRQWETLMWKYGLTTSDGTTIRDNPSNKPLCDNDGILCNGECYDKCESHMIGKCTPNGVICEGDPNNCPSGQISCNGQCWQMCYGNPQCTPQGLVCYY